MTEMFLRARMTWECGELGCKFEADRLLKGRTVEDQKDRERR